MFNQSCHCQGMNTQPCGQIPGCKPTPRPCGCQNNTAQGCAMPRPCGCGMNNMNGCGCTMNGCPRPAPIVAPKKVCVTNQVTPVPQPVICPIECRRVNHCVYYPVYYPQYEQTFVTESANRPY